MLSGRNQCTSEIWVYRRLGLNLGFAIQVTYCDINFLVCQMRVTYHLGQR